MPVDFGQNDVSAGTVEAVSKPRNVTPLADFGENDISERSAVPQNMSSNQIISPAFGGPDPHTLGVSEGFLRGFASDDQEIINIAAQSVFPDMPLAESAKRFGKTTEGQIFYMDESGMPVPVHDSNMSSLFSIVGPMLPLGAGTATGIVTAPAATTGVGFIGTVAATGGAAAAGENARQQIGDYFLGDRSTNDLNVRQIAMEGVLSGAGQVLGGGIGHNHIKRQVHDIARMESPQTRRAYEMARQQGITITPGQATGLRSILGAEKRLATRVPETIDAMDEFATTQGEQVVAAFKRNMDAIAPNADGEDVGIAVRNAAKEVLDDVKAARSARAKPYYDKAFESGPIHDDRIAEMLNDPIMKEALAEGVPLQRLEALADGVPFNPTDLAITGFNEAGDPILGAVPNMRTIQAIKEGLDSMIKESVNSVGSLTKRGAAIQRLQKAFLKKVDSYNPDYAEARRIYAGESSLVDDAYGSALNTLANIKDTAILRTVGEAFRGTTRTPKMVGRLRMALEGKNPEAWAGLKRLWIDDAVDMALKPTRTGVVNNPAGSINGVLNHPNVAPNLAAAFSKDEQTALANLKLVLGRIAKYSAQGSDTAANLVTDQMARSDATSIPAHAIKLLKVWDIPAMIADKMTERNMAKQAQHLLRVVTSGDEAMLKQLKELRQMPEPQWRKLMGWSQLAAQGAPVTVAGVSSALDD